MVQIHLVAPFNRSRVSQETVGGRFAQQLDSLGLVRTHPGVGETPAVEI